jgi:hypothetical protein
VNRGQASELPMADDYAELAKALRRALEHMVAGDQNGAI